MLPREGKTNTFILISGYQLYYTTFSFSFCSLLFEVSQVWKILYGCSCKKKNYLGRASKGEMKWPQNKWKVLLKRFLLAALLWCGNIYYDTNSGTNRATGIFSVREVTRVTWLNKIPVCFSQYSIVIRTIKKNKNHRLQSKGKGR